MTYWAFAVLRGSHNPVSTVMDLITYSRLTAIAVIVDEICNVSLAQSILIRIIKQRT